MNMGGYNDGWGFNGPFAGSGLVPFVGPLPDPSRATSGRVGPDPFRALSGRVGPDPFNALSARVGPDPWRATSTRRQ